MSPVKSSGEAQRAKLALLLIARALGMFALARAVTAKRLRILCYHGIAFADEHRFRPGLFMSATTFEERMRYLAERRYPVLALARALELLRDGKLPRCATVITIDDGWYGIYAQMGPILKSYRFPATLYVSSYYMEKGTQVFNVALRYAFWAARFPSLDLGSISEQLSGVHELADEKGYAEAESLILDLADRMPSAAERQQLLRKIFDVLGVDWRPIEEGRLLAFMNADEARELYESGIDIQLHTHRHRFPAMSEAELAAEIEDNRRALARVTNGPLAHLCYPSGEYTRASFALLERMGVASATTTKRGMNTRETPLLELRRLLDADDTPPIVLEAEMSGLLELCRLGLHMLARQRN